MTLPKTTIQRAKFLFIAAISVAGALSLHAACTTQETLGQAGAVCVDDGQCVTPLSCVCIRKLSTDDEGTDQVLQNGFCGGVGTKCPTDAGVPDSASHVDATAETIAPDAADASATDATDATDASAADATDAADAAAESASADVAADVTADALDAAGG